MNIESTIEYLFVYGTLRRDVTPSKHALLAEWVEWVAYATLQGRLYEVAGYPGAVLSAEAPSEIVIKGELFRILDSAALWPILDDYEECSVHVEQPHEYLRQRVWVQTDQKQAVQAWTYLYNRPTDGLHWIESGDYQSF